MLTPSSATDDGPLVSRPQSGLEHRCPALWARRRTIGNGKSSRLIDLSSSVPFERPSPRLAEFDFPTIITKLMLCELRRQSCLKIDWFAGDGVVEF
jgi:hypothetical protein